MGKHKKYCSIGNHYEGRELVNGLRDRYTGSVNVVFVPANDANVNPPFKKGERDSVNVRMNTFWHAWDRCGRQFNKEFAIEIASGYGVKDVLPLPDDYNGNYDLSGVIKQYDWSGICQTKKKEKGPSICEAITNMQGAETNEHCE